MAGRMTRSEPVTSSPAPLAACGSKNQSRARCRESGTALPGSPCLHWHGGASGLSSARRVNTHVGMAVHAYRQTRAACLAES